MLEALEQPATPDSTAADAANTDTTIGDDLQTTDVEEGADLDTQQAAPDEAEDEVEGVKLKGPKDALERFKAERLMQKDYTQKTQATAEDRKALAAERTQFEQTAKSHQEHIREVAQVVAIDDRLAQFANVNWQTLTDQDPVQALKLHTEFTQLQARRGQLVGSLTQKQQERQQEQQRTHAKQLMEARQVLERDIKGWSPELAGKLMDYGLTQGFSAETLNNITQPALVKSLHKAYLYDQLQKQRQAKPTATPAPPVTRVSGAAASSTKPLSEVSDAEYNRRRREYIQKHR